MVARSNEDGSKTFSYVCERGETQIKWELQKSNLNRSTGDNEAIYSASCHAQSNDGHIYIEVGKFNGWPVKVLQDTGCTRMIVDTALIPYSMVIPGSSGSLQMVDYTLINVPLDNVYLDSPYFKRHCKVMYVRYSFIL